MGLLDFFENDVKKYGEKLRNMVDIKKIKNQCLEHIKNGY